MLLMVLIIGFSIGQIAVFANGGSEKDPLITMSYMNQKIEQLKYYVDSKVDGGETLENKQSSAWEVVKLAKGQSIVGESSTEFILRSGKGTAIASASGGLCDVTIGKDLSKGVNIEKNHLLIVPRSDGRGILASSEIYIMVKGNYQIIQ